MDDSFTQMYSSEPFEAPAPRQEIRALPTPPPPPPRAAATGTPTVLRWAVDDELNSRIPLPLAWDARDGAAPELRFKADLPDTLTPVNILAAGDRLVISGPGPWALLDLSGRLIAETPSALGSVTLDAAGGRVVGGNSDGTLQLWRLADAARDATPRPFRLRDHSRSYLATRGSRLLMLSNVLDTDVHAAPEEKSMIEVIDVAHPEGPYPTHALHKAGPMQTALRGDTVYIASLNRVFLLDLELKFRQAWAGEFKPIAISVDEAQNVYLLVLAGGKAALWKLTPKAERAWTVPVSLVSGMIIQPPIVGYDHSVYLVTPRQLMAFSAEGQPLWTRDGAGTIRGAFVTSDDRLVTAEGSQIAAWNLKGERQVVFDCGDSLVTPPILTPGGTIYAASPNRLYCVRVGK